MKPFYVIGHKNPDCDSIVSSIAYANLKNQLGFESIACAQGKCNKETKYLLNRFGFEHPTIIHSAKCTLKEIEKDEALTVPKGITIHEAFAKVLSRKNKGLFVVNEDQTLHGIVSISDLTKMFTMNVEALTDLMSRCQLENIVSVLKAKIYHQAEQFVTSGTIHILPSMSDDKKEYKKSIVILRNNPDEQRFAILAGASLIIVSGEDWIDKVTLDLAKQHHTSIIYTSCTVLECSRFLFEACSIDEFTTTQVVSFYEDEMVDDVSNRLAKTRFRTYPVLNKDRRVIAAISRYHLFNYEKKRFILMDHNEVTQTVNDIEFGEVCEVIDHHRMGGLETTHPIMILEQVVGSTSTIVTTLYRQHQIEPSKNMAGLLLGGILNDTLCLKSPTTTETDLKMVEYLSKLSGIVPEELNQKMVAESDSILNKSHLELLYDDFKEFRIANCRVAIGQIQTKKWDEYHKIREPFLKYLDEVALSQQYDLILMMFTDPTGSGSYFLFTGKKSWVIEDGFKEYLNEDHFAKGMISRKKQVLPVIIDKFNQ